MGPFSIVQWGGALAYWLNLGTTYSQVHPIFYISLLKPFRASGDGCCIQQLCMLKMSKNGKSVGYLDTKDVVEEISGCIFKIQEI